MCFRHKEQYSTWFNYHEFNFEFLQRNTAWKAIFSISRRPEKMVFPKELRWNIIFFKLSGNMIFFPPKIWSYPQMENEDDLSQKNQKKTREIWYFLEMFWKDGIFKKDCAGTSSFLYYLGGCYFFPENTVFFYPDGKWERWPFARNTRKHDIFYLICSTSPC